MQAPIVRCLHNQPPCTSCGTSRPQQQIRRFAGQPTNHVPSRSRQRQLAAVPPLAGGGGSGAGSFGGNSRGGGGGGDDSLPGNGSGDDATQRKKSIFGWKGWNDRVAADPQFTYKVFIEQIIGVGAAVIGDMSSRPYWGLYELDFVFSTLVVGSILNFSLMYLLAPTAAAAGVGRQSLLAKLFSEQTLKAWGAPGGHMFERGYPFTARLTNLAYKGLVFALVGFSAGIVGTLMSNTLLAIRKQLDPKFESQNKPPNVLLNAGTWATHMGLSSNLRYQLINGLDMVVQPAVPAGVFKLLTSLLRTGNNLLGGVSFVTLAKLFGVQSSAGDAIKTQVKAEHVAVEKAQERADKLPTSPNLHDTDKRKAVKR